MIKEMLENYMNYKAEIKAIEYKIKQIEKEDISIGSSSFFVNGDIKAKGYKSSIVENKAIKNVDRARLLEKQKEELQAKIDMIDSYISILKLNNRNVVIKFYIEKKGIKQIANEMDRTEKTIARILSESVKYLEKIYRN